MSKFKVHTLETAPAEARGLFEEVKKAYGFVPNLIAVMAEAPPVAKAYLALSRLFEETSLTPAEKQVVLLAVSYENNCTYCMAAHSGGAERAGVSPEAIAALRAGQPLRDSKLETLRRFTAAIVRTRGMPGAEEIVAFLDAGYSRKNILEVILGVTVKTLSNYVNHVADTPLDAAFEAKRWKKSS